MSNALFKTSHSTTTHKKNEENVVFNEEALLAARNIKVDKKSYKEMYKNMKNDKFVKMIDRLLDNIKGVL